MLPIIPISSMYTIWESTEVKYFCHIYLFLLCLAPQSSKNCQARSAELTAISLSWWGLNCLAIHRSDLCSSRSSTDRLKAFIFHEGCVCVCGCGWCCPENPGVPPNRSLKSWYFNLWLNQEYPFRTSFRLHLQFTSFSLVVWLQKQLMQAAVLKYWAASGYVEVCGIATVQELYCKQFPHGLQAGRKRQSNFRLQLRLVLQPLFIYDKCRGKYLRMGWKWQN